MPTSVGDASLVEYLQEAYAKDLAKVLFLFVLSLVNHVCFNYPFSLVSDQRCYAKDLGARTLDRTRFSRHICHALQQEIIQSLRFERKSLKQQINFKSIFHTPIASLSAIQISDVFG